MCLAFTVCSDNLFLAFTTLAQHLSSFYIMLRQPVSSVYVCLDNMCLALTYSLATYPRLLHPFRRVYLSLACTTVFVSSLYVRFSNLSLALSGQPVCSFYNGLDTLSIAVTFTGAIFQVFYIRFTGR